jgi:hypothetical protein
VKRDANRVADCLANEGVAKEKNTSTGKHKSLETQISQIGVKLWPTEISNPQMGCHVEREGHVGKSWGMP